MNLRPFKALQVRFSTFLHSTWITSENCLHDCLAAQYEQGKHKDCELCLDEFRIELLRDIDMLLMFKKVSKLGLLRW